MENRVCNSRFSAKVSNESIQINYDEKEVLYWDKQEWIEDPMLCVVIANVINEALTRPDYLYESLKKVGKL